MIDINEQGIGYTDFAKISENQSEFIKYLIKTKIDFIIDCTEVSLEKNSLKKYLTIKKM